MFQALTAFITVMSGYVFVSTWHRTRYLLLRQPSQRIYFRAAFWGFWLYVLALAVTLLGSRTFEAEWARVWQSVSPLVPELGLGVAAPISKHVIASLVLCLVMGMLGGYALNWCELLRRWPKDWRLSLLTTLKGDKSVVMGLYGLTSRRPLRRAVEYLNADLERILLRALREEQPICLSMADRKVYIGFLCGAVDPSDMNDMLRILPYMSGFRSSESLELVITDYYDELYLYREGESVIDTADTESSKVPASRRDQSDFEVALPIREIRSCRLFDTRLYLQYQQRKRTVALGFVQPSPDIYNAN